MAQFSETKHERKSGKILSQMSFSLGNSTNMNILLFPSLRQILRQKFQQSKTLEEENKKRKEIFDRENKKFLKFENNWESARLERFARFLQRANSNCNFCEPLRVSPQVWAPGAGSLPSPRPICSLFVCSGVLRLYVSSAGGVHVPYCFCRNQQLFRILLNSSDFTKMGTQNFAAEIIIFLKR